MTQDRNGEDIHVGYMVEYNGHNYEVIAINFGFLDLAPDSDARGYEEDIPADLVTLV